jgi:hypothetical protein
MLISLGKLQKQKEMDTIICKKRVKEQKRTKKFQNSKKSVG